MDSSLELDPEMSTSHKQTFSVQLEPPELKTLQKIQGVRSGSQKKIQGVMSGSEQRAQEKLEQLAK
jgi:hypothetical protein